MSREYNRRQFIDLALNTAAVGGLAILLDQIPFATLSRKLLGTSTAPDHYLPRLIQDWDLRAEAAALPLVQTSRTFTVIPGADVTSGIAALSTNALVAGDGSSAGTDNTDTTYIKNSGSSNIKVLFSGGTSSQLHHLVWTPLTLSMNTIPTIGLRFYQANAWDTAAGSLILSNNADGSTNNFRYQLNGLQYPLISSNVEEWIFHQVHRAETTLTNGSPSYASTIANITLQIRGAVPSGATLVYVDQLYYDGYQHPVIPWIFSGGPDTHYDTVFPAMTARGMVGTIAIPTDRIDGGAGFLTSAELDEMQDAGWGIMHMSDTITTQIGLTVAQNQTRIGTAETTMASFGYTNCAKHTLPAAAGLTADNTDANLRTALSSMNYKSAVNKWGDGTSGGAVSPMGIDPIHGIAINPYRVPGWHTNNPDTTTETQAHIDHIIKAGGARCLITGGVVAGAAVGQMESTDFTTILNYLALRHHAGTLSVLPYQKFYPLYSGRSRVLR